MDLITNKVQIIQIAKSNKLHPTQFKISFSFPLEAKRCTGYELACITRKISVKVIKWYCLLDTFRVKQRLGTLII